MKITFIQTGGTIDKDYPHPIKGWAFEIGEPAVKRILKRLQPSFDYTILCAFKKDSLEIDDTDRMALASLMRDQSDSKFIITHGTDTMLDTATFLQREVPDALIILTGAMRPERFRNSDADLNLGAAIASANILHQGVFIAMHGIVKSWEAMKRDLTTGKFY